MTLQETIIAQLGVKPSIDPKEEIRKSVDFLKAYMLKHPFLKTYVLGISGGQDSTLAGRLAQLAIEELRAETGKDYQFIAIRLPYGVQADEDDAQRALAFIKPDVSLTVNIKEAVDGQVAELAKVPQAPRSIWCANTTMAACRCITSICIVWKSPKGSKISTITALPKAMACRL